MIVHIFFFSKQLCRLHIVVSWHLGGHGEDQRGADRAAEPLPPPAQGAQGMDEELEIPTSIVP